MLTPYTAPVAAARVRTEIKKSLFIADLAPVSTMEEALAYWAARKKEFPDATHHCFACRVGHPQAAERSSDDGEPQGTAGHPMLRALQAAGVTNAALVVTRYFGGVKLGTGGLSRAYGGAAASVLSAASLSRYEPRLAVTLRISYDALGAVERALAETDVIISDRAFTDEVTLSLLAPPAAWPERLALLTNLTAGRLKVEEGEETFVALTTMNNVQ